MMGGIQMQMIARTILVDELTGSAFITGIVGMGFAPSMLLLSLFGGVAGDKLERRSLIQISQVGNAVLALTVGVLIALGIVHWTHLLAVSVLQGALFAFHMPARQAVIPKLVGNARVTNAVALSAGGMSIVAIAAPGLAGVIYGSLGPEYVYFVIAGLVAASVFMTGRIPKIPPEPSTESRSIVGDIKAGISYVASNRVVLLLITSGLTVAILAMPFRLQLPVFARRLYGEETIVDGGIRYVFAASDVGWLLVLAGVGGIIGTLLVANLRKGQHRGMIILLAAILSGVALLFIGAFPLYVVGLGAMVAVGLAESLRMTLAQSLTIESTDGAYRARVMSLNMMTFGLMPLGALPLGIAIDVFGAQAALTGMAVIVIVAGALFLLSARTLRRLG